MGGNSGNGKKNKERNTIKIKESLSLGFYL